MLALSVGLSQSFVSPELDHRRRHPRRRKIIIIVLLLHSFPDGDGVDGVNDDEIGGVEDGDSTDDTNTNKIDEYYYVDPPVEIAFSRMQSAFRFSLLIAIIGP